MIVISTYIEKLKNSHSQKNLDFTRLIFIWNDYKYSPFTRK